MEIYLELLAKEIQLFMPMMKMFPLTASVIPLEGHLL